MQHNMAAMLSFEQAVETAPGAIMMGRGPHASARSQGGLHAHACTCGAACTYACGAHPDATVMTESASISEWPRGLWTCTSSWPGRVSMVSMGAAAAADTSSAATATAVAAQVHLLRTRVIVRGSRLDLSNLNKLKPSEIESALYARCCRSQCLPY